MLSFRYKCNKNITFLDPIYSPLRVTHLLNSLFVEGSSWASSNRFEMCGPRADNRNGESCDSCDNHPSVTVQTEWSRVQGTNYQESVEESSKPQDCFMIGHNVYKRYGEKIYEGAVESYNIVTHVFKVVYDNGCFDEIEADDIINYFLHHRNNDGGEKASSSVPVQPSRNLPCWNDGSGQNASPSAPAQTSKQFPCRNNGGGENASPSALVQPSRVLPRGYATGKMTIKDSNDGGRARTRPLMMRAVNDQPRRARKHRVKSSSRKRLTCENVKRAAPVRPSSEVGIQGWGRKRALRMRAENAGDINPPRQASKRRVHRSSRRHMLYKEYKRSVYIYYSPGADKDDDDSDWEE